MQLMDLLQTEIVILEVGQHFVLRFIFTADLALRKLHMLDKTNKSKFLVFINSNLQ
jgi:hypothetical protein